MFFGNLPPVFAIRTFLIGMGLLFYIIACFTGSIYFWTAGALCFLLSLSFPREE